MKKQIKKLVKKTYLYDNYETVADRQQKIYSFTEEGLEKFAELIVRDCMDVVDGYTKGRTFDTHYNAVEQIEALFGIKHNGVEE
jgi:DNA-binding PadR family transcriptional regulator